MGTKGKNPKLFGFIRVYPRLSADVFLLES